MKIITREEYQEYLKEQRKRQQSDKLSPEMRTFIKENISDIRKAFIETNISTIGFSIKPKPKITLYQAFCTEYPFITISEENFNKAYNETHTTNLDHLKDYILAKGLEEEIEFESSTLSDKTRQHNCLCKVPYQCRSIPKRTLSQNKENGSNKTHKEITNTDPRLGPSK